MGKGAGNRNPVYPRVCGGTRFDAPDPGTPRGLSPRVRGNHRGHALRQMPDRSIPACAGEPRRIPVGTPAPGVYPRVCGGTPAPRRTPHPRPGLSPRVRENLAGQCNGRNRIGSIPACAGEPSYIGQPPDWGLVYPRVCGGTISEFTVWRTASGLSPRVRGNLAADAVRGGNAGSIPACAGEPPKPAGTRPNRRVYPRVCGGTRASSSRRSWASGLSPRVRGNPAADGRGHGAGRSIPACAGEPVVTQHHRPPMGVYPRVCGGTQHSQVSLFVRVGLSPRVRGNPSRSTAPSRTVRSIPACAGEPPKPGAVYPLTMVYPRVCGGTGDRYSFRRLPYGLSPRVRGNRPCN